MCARYRLADYGRVYAYGDSPEDGELLALAHHRSYRWQEQDEDAAPGGSTRRAGAPASAGGA